MKLAFTSTFAAASNDQRPFLTACSGDVAMEDPVRVALIEEVVEALAAQSETLSKGHSDPHVLYAQHIYSQLESLQNSAQHRNVAERFVPAMQEVLLR